MSFNSKYGNPAPLKILDYLQTINGLTSGRAVWNNQNLGGAYGRNTFFAYSTNKNRYCASYGNPLASGNSYGQLWQCINYKQTANADSLQAYYDRTETLNPANVVVKVSTTKLSSYGTYSYYTPIEKMGAIVKGSGTNLEEMRGYGVECTASEPYVYLTNVKPFSEVADYLVITGFDVWYGDTLPRQKINNYAPTLYLDSAGCMGYNSGDNYAHLKQLRWDNVVACQLGIDSNAPTVNYTYGNVKNVIPDTYGYMDSIVTATAFEQINLPYDINRTIDFRAGIGGNRYKTPYSGQHLILMHNYASDYHITPKMFGIRTAIDRFLMCPSNIPNSRAYRCYENEQAIIDTFSDWGVTVVFDDDTAQNYPADLIPSAPDIPNGFPTNDVVTDLPSFPDNTNNDFDIDKPPYNPVIPTVNSCILNVGGVNNLFDWFVNESFWDRISKLFEGNALSAIISLKAYPFDIVGHDSGHTTAVSGVRVANVTRDNIAGYIFGDNYNHNINGGELSYTPYYGDYNDWINAQYSLYIPYCGVIPMPPSAVINKTLKITYVVDFVSGKACCVVKTYDSKYNTSGYVNGQIVYSGECVLSQDIPIVYSNYNQQQLTTALTAITGIGSTISNVAGLVATSGATAGTAVPSIISSLASPALSYINNPVEMGAKGSASTTTAYYLPQTAYLLINRKKVSYPDSGYITTAGKGSALWASIGSAGAGVYVQATGAKLNIDCTESELGEIKSLLASGVFV